MVLNSRTAFVLAFLALLGGIAAVYIPASQLSARIDAAKQQEDDAVANTLRARLLSAEEEHVRTAATLFEATSLNRLSSGFGESMRAALDVDALVLLDASGRQRLVFADLETPSGLGKTTAARSIARRAGDVATVQSGFVRAYGQAYIVGAIRLSDPPEGLETKGEPVVAIVFTRLEPASLLSLSHEYRLTGLDLVERRPSGTSYLSLYDIRGGEASYLTWQTTSPTSQMLDSLGPWFIAVLSVVGVILVTLALLALRANRAATSARLAAAVLEKADKAKSLLFANLSHEFRTPLNAVIGFSEVMQLRMFGPLGHAKYDEYTRDINSSARHLLGLIEDVLMLSRYEAGDGVTLDDEVAVAAVVEDAVTMLAQAASRKGLSLIVDPMGDATVLASEKGLRQIIVNLASNAIKYTETGIVRISLAGKLDADTVTIEVSDSGIGIPEDQLDRITLPFEQIDDVYARRQGGTGLGLSIVKTILQRAGGSMRIDSQVGSGTTVTVTLRRATQPPAQSLRRAA